MVKHALKCPVMIEQDFQTIMQARHRRYVSTYAQASCIIDTIGAALLERLSFIKIQPQRILDIGSSLAYTSRALACQYPHANIIAVDFCHSMNQQARLNSLTLPQIQFLTADAYQLPIKNHSIDLIVANLLLPALLDYPSLWQECQRVLIPGGLLMFSNLGPDTLKELKSSLAAIDATPRINAFIDLHDVGDGLVAAAFRDPVLDNDYYHLSYSSLTALLHELKTLGSIKFIDAIESRYVGKAFWHAVEHCYQQHFPAPKQRLLVTIEAYFGHAFNPLHKPQHMDNDGQISIAVNAIKRPL